MSETVHERALRLIAQARVEGIADAENVWLRAHLEECELCAESARSTDRALQMMRTAAIALPSGLAKRTQFRVRLRAQQLQEREPRRRALWFACAVSWVFGIFTAPYVWNLFQWFGKRAGMPKLVWEVGFGLWWTIPALFAIVVVILEGSRQSGQTKWTRQDI